MIKLYTLNNQNYYESENYFSFPADALAFVSRCGHRDKIYVLVKVIDYTKEKLVAVGNLKKLVGIYKKEFGHKETKMPKTLTIKDKYLKGIDQVQTIINKLIKK